jgi:hypothetical protein
MRLLAAAARVVYTDTHVTTSSTSSSSSSTPAPLLQLLSQLQTSLQGLSKASQSDSSATDSSSINDDDLTSVWPFSLGPDGVAAAAQLVTR